MFKLEQKLSMPIKQLAPMFEARAQKVGTVIGRALAEHTTEEVVKRIPDFGGWYRIYRDAIEYKESPDGREWAVVGEVPVDLKQIPANASLIYFDGMSEIGAVMKAYNPWPVDKIPPIAGGYNDKLKVRPSFGFVVNSNRKRIKKLLPAIQQNLQELGAQLLPPSEMVEARGKVYADLVTLAACLEEGCGDFPRVRHWKPAASKLERRAQAWATDPQVAEEVNGVLDGKKLAPPSTKMAANEAAKFRQQRDRSWS